MHPGGNRNVCPNKFFVVGETVDDCVNELLVQRIARGSVSKHFKHGSLFEFSASNDSRDCGTKKSEGELSLGEKIMQLGSVHRVS